MHYYAKITEEDGAWVVSFPDCPGCYTQGDTKEEAIAMAHEALEGWLESHIARNSTPPQPKAQRGVAIAVATPLACALQIRWSREARGLTQAEAAKRMGVSQQAFAKLEQPGSNPQLVTLVKVSEAIGASLDVVMSKVTDATIISSAFARIAKAVDGVEIHSVKSTRPVDYGKRSVASLKKVAKKSAAHKTGKRSARASVEKAE